MKVRIESLAGGGSGIAKDEGKVYFVSGGIPGDHLEIKVVRDKGRFAEAIVMDIIEPSPDRVEPVCPVFERCGGCELQNMSYGAQLRQKENILRDTLERIGGIEGVNIEPITPSPKDYGYRNRVTLSAFFYSGSWHVGYNQKRSKRKVTIDGCPVADGPIEAAISRLSGVLSSVGDPAYALDKVHISSNSEHAYITLAVEQGKRAASLNPLAKHLKRYEETENISVLGQGEVEFEYECGGYRFLSKPSVFAQANYEVNKAIVDTVLEWSGTGGNDRVLDLYSGSGNFSIPLSRESLSVDAVEVNRSAVSLAKRSAKLNNADNITFHDYYSEQYLSYYADGVNKFDTIVLDPPREGAKECIEGIVKLKPKRIIYVSCDAATLARDLKSLSGYGYDVFSVRPFDMFPETSHIESATLVSGA